MLRISFESGSLLTFLIRLVNSATVEAQEIYEKLLLREEISFRMALFSLQRYLRVRYLDPPLLALWN
jgi:hypothetical protein